MHQPRTARVSHVLFIGSLILFGGLLALHAFSMLAFLNEDALAAITSVDFILGATQATIYAAFAYYLGGKWARYDHSETERLCAPLLRRTMLLALIPAYTAALLSVQSFAAPWPAVLLWTLDMLLIVANGLGVTLWLARDLPETAFSRYPQRVAPIVNPLMIGGLAIWFSLIIVALTVTFA